MMKSTQIGSLPQPMSLSTVCVFRPETILSVHCTQDLLHWVRQSLDAGAEYLLIDLCQVRFMDGGGVGALISALNYVRRSTARLVLCQLNPQHQMVLELTETLHTFDICQSVDDFQRKVPTTTFYPVGS